VEALNYLRSGLDLSLVTPTASGKTLCYNLPIIESSLNQPQTTALYIFPLKALAFDQMRKLGQLVEAMPPQSHQLKVGLMTGDTPKEERLRLFIPKPPNILAVSPDLLHHHLYNLRRRDDGEPWRQFLRQLRWVVIDEAHTYVGAFGAHFANLMRRLRLAVDSVGGNSDQVQFICASATVGNPKEMALRFSGRERHPERLRLIERSGAGSSGRTLLCLNPSTRANPDASKIILSWLQHDLSGIVFCNSRTALKSLLGLLQREAQRQGLSYLASKVAIFYGSLTGDRRREIIQQLQSRRLKVILSTSALEAGIDLPELDCCLLRGFPGSLMSFWQRVGRAGRSQHGLVVFLPVAQNPIDAFYGRNPEQLLSAQIESAAFNPDYPTILSQHLECSCVESGIPLAQLTTRFGLAAGQIADGLLQQDKLFLSRNGQLWGRGYPHKNFSLRSSANTSISLTDKHSGEVLETMPKALAQREVFPGAIYTLQDADGEVIAYRSESLDQQRGEAVLAYIGKSTDLFTEAFSESNIKLLSPLADAKIITTSLPENRLRLTLAWGEITTLVTGYRMLTRKYSNTCTWERCSNYRQSLEGITCSYCKRPLRWSEITQVTQEFEFDLPLTTHYQAPVLKIELNQPLKTSVFTNVNQIKEQIRKVHDTIPDQLMHLWQCSPDFIALHTMAHQIIKAVPLVVLSSHLDVDALFENSQSSTISYFFDTCPGGNGATEAIFQKLDTFAAKAKALATDCDCESGCPRCLTQHGCPQQNIGLHKDAGLFLLALISAKSEENSINDRLT
jgi:DEAD/DEAH box helicase domain-containing protein